MKTVLLVLCLLSICLSFVCAAFNRQSNSAAKNVFSNPVVARKVDVDRQGGLGATLIAGPIFLALSTLLLPFLPLLLIAPLIATVGPTFGTINEVASDANNPTSPLNEALQAFSSIAGDIGGASNSGGSNTKPGSSAAASSPIASIQKPSQQTTTNNRPQSSSESEGSILQQLANFASEDGNSEGLFPLLSSLTSGSSSNSNSNNGNPSLQQLAGNALNTISNFLFSNRRSELLPWNESLKTRIPLKHRPGVIAYLKDVYNTIRYGMRRYEIKELECQQRLICELHQKAIGRSLRPMANVVLDSLGVENQLERSMAFAGRTKTYLKDFYRAVKSGIAEKECAEVYSRCPVNIAVEPSNSLFNGLFRRKSQKERPLEHLLAHQNQNSAVQSNLAFKPNAMIYMRNPS